MWRSGLYCGWVQSAPRAVQVRGWWAKEHTKTLPLVLVWEMPVTAPPEASLPAGHYPAADRLLSHLREMTGLTTSIKVCDIDPWSSAHASPSAGSLYLSIQVRVDILRYARGGHSSTVCLSAPLSGQRIFEGTPHPPPAVTRRNTSLTSTILAHQSRWSKPVKRTDFNVPTCQYGKNAQMRHASMKYSPRSPICFPTTQYSLRPLRATLKRKKVDLGI